MTHEELNTTLYKKLFAEQERYKEWLLTLPPEEILNHAYEYIMREDIVLAMEYHNLTDQQAKALLSSLTPLADIFHDFEQIEGDHMDIICGCIKTRANNILTEQAAALLNLPVYTANATYAKEHGEADLYRASYEANIACRNAIEDAITENYRDNRLDSASAVKAVITRFGLERVSFVLAATVQDKEWDGRISIENKRWARTFTIPQDETPWNTKWYRHYAVSNAHPGLVDMFVSRVRNELELQKSKNPKGKCKEAER